MEVAVEVGEGVRVRVGDVEDVLCVRHRQLERERVVVPRAALDVVLVVAHVEALTPPADAVGGGRGGRVDEREQAKVEERVLPMAGGRGGGL